MEQAMLPNMDHFSYKDGQSVYEPAEDTFLLCDGILNDKESLLQLDPDIIVEIGSGSGCVIVFTTMLMNSLMKERSHHSSFALDINPKALQMTQQTASANNVTVQCIESNLFSSIESTHAGKIDVLIFNPPYVPTESDEVFGNGIEAAWAGGIDGREVIDRFIPYLPIMLSSKGVCYMILVQENKPSEIADILLTKYGLHSKIIINRRAVNEGLMVMKIWR